MLIPKPLLWFGPMSQLSVAAVYKYSHEKQVSLGLTCSLNQINYLGGYTGWKLCRILSSYSRNLSRCYGGL